MTITDMIESVISDTRVLCTSALDALLEDNDDTARNMLERAAENIAIAHAALGRITDFLA